MVNTQLTVDVSLANSENGTPVYSERHFVTSNFNCLISLLIGNGVFLSGDWSETDSSKDAYILNKPNICDSIGNYLTTNKNITETDLCPTIESNCNNVPLKSGDNVFAGNNNFTSGTITVPSNPTAIAKPSTFGSCTDSNAVNVCDLLAAFDSQHIGGHASFWTSTEVFRVTSFYRSLGYDYPGVVRNGYARYLGMAVRCLRD